MEQSVRAWRRLERIVSAGSSFGKSCALSWVSSHCNQRCFQHLLSAALPCSISRTKRRQTTPDTRTVMTTILAYDKSTRWWLPDCAVTLDMLCRLIFKLTSATKFAPTVWDLRVGATAPSTVKWICEWVNVETWGHNKTTFVEREGRMFNATGRWHVRVFLKYDLVGSCPSG